MSLENTKPRWAPQSIATERGWTDPVTGEVYVAIGNLKSRLEAISAPVVTPIPEAINQTVVEVKEVVMKEEVKPEEAPKRRGRPAKQVNEVVEQPLAEGQRVIGEVVEQPENTQILGE